jgi:protein-L-isoaspartate(D-aspartate) O-methyltransferase
MDYRARYATLEVAVERADERDRMVSEQIEARGVRDPAVLRAMRAVPRHRFVPPSLAAEAYADRALPADEEQTISQPYIVALMAASLAIRPGARVLELGTGTGYAAAVMAAAGAEVWTIEIRAPLAASAASRLLELGVSGVHVRCGDGSLGWAEHAPYSGITVAASGPDVPVALLDQLAVGGHLVLPLDSHRGVQQLTRITRAPDGAFTRESLGAVLFVPLVHAH